MAGVTISTAQPIDPDTGDLLLEGSAVATGGGNATVTGVAVESLTTVGTGSGTFPADGQVYGWQARIPPVGGAWQSGGSGFATAVLTDANGAQVATGFQLIAVQ